MAEKPSPVTHHEYDIPSLNSWFAWSAAALLVVSVWMIWADYARDFKEYQRRFNDIEIARTKAQLQEVDQSIDRRAFESVQTKLTAAEETIAGQQATLADLAGQIEGLEGTWYAADQAFKFAKADLDVVRYELDEAHHKGRGVDVAQKHFDDVTARVEATRLAFEEVDTQTRELQAEIDAINADKTAAERERDALLKDRTLLEGRLAKIDHSFVKDYFRDRPLVDFMAPTLKVKQVVLPNLHEDVNFMTVPRVDRCHSCHLGIDRPGWTEETLPPEFRTHSRLDAIIGNHPVDQFGCTGCHSGGGRAITFSDAAHTPQNDEQAARWKEEQHWHRLHHWDFPQLPLQYVQAGCANCHADETRIEGADDQFDADGNVVVYGLNQGRQLIEDYGCFGCHKIDRPGYRDLRKVGPDLSHLRGKVTKDWMTKWVTEPQSFRPTTKMPRVWGNSNTAKATATMNYPLRDQVEIRAVVNYMMSTTSDYDDLETPTGTGDAERGSWLVENRGCKACHVVGEGDTGEGRARADHGPNLNQVGSKLTVEWMYNWVKDPKKLWADTRMPNLRLTDQEAHDIATYLATLKNPEFDALEAADVSSPEAQQMLEDVAYEYLRKETTTADAKARLSAMDEDARLDYLGRKLIQRQGCFGCHPGMPGFEDAQPIGTELTTWASKLKTQLDFGLTGLPHTHVAFLTNKLREPRIYDTGKVETKHPQDLLRMPNFGFTETQIHQITTAVLGFSRDLVQLEGHRRLSFREDAIEQGRRVVQEYNCQGCHVIESKGGGMETVLEGGKPYSPPVLSESFETPDGRFATTRQGSKTQPDWFFSFLKQPTSIRPWLHIRMPTFGLDDDDATTLVRYFAALAEEPFPYTYLDASELDPTLVAEGKKLFEQFQCVNCHLPLEEAKKLGVQESELAPNLELAKERLQYAWLADWLRDPGAIQEGTRMPAFFYLWDEDEQAYMKLRPDAEREIDALRAYLQFHGGPLPSTKLARR